jgi:hypothetical protein
MRRNFPTPFLDSKIFLVPAHDGDQDFIGQ